MRWLWALLLFAGCSPQGGVGTDETLSDTGGTDTAGLTCEERGLTTQPWGCSWDCTEDVSVLGVGVGTVDIGGALPASIILTGERSCIAMMDPDGRVLVASSRVDEGRVWAAGHETYLSSVLASKALTWASGGAGTVMAPSSMASTITGLGLVHQEVDLGALDGASALVLDAYGELSEAERAAVGAWVRAGGGLLMAGQAWWWANSNDTPAALDYPANAVLADAGLVITSDPAWSAGVDTPLVAPAEDWYHHRHALKIMQAAWDGLVYLSTENQRTAVTTSLVALDALPLARQDYYSVAIEYSDAVGPVVPTSDMPIDTTTQLPQVLAARVQGKLYAELPAAEVEAFPGVEDFPGPVTTSERVSRTVAILASYDGRDGSYLYSGAGADVWRSTGLYVPAGELVEVRVPAALVNRGVSLLVGAWTDRLWNKDEWQRFPEVVRSTAVDSEQVSVASAFGGPLYIRIPAGLDAGEVEVEVDGVVPMSRYHHGQTPADGWKLGADAPWAEVGSDRFVMTVPSEALVDVPDAEALMTFWDGVLDGMAAMEGTAAERPRAERFVVDRQISAGWMHSGYPIMAHLVSAEEVLSLEGLQAQGAWGPFHELGHNHQYSDWILPGTTETTCNLFSVYASEEHSGIDRGVAHSALDPASREARLTSYVNGGANFSDWSVWVALETYLQLQEAFGWDFYTDVFTDYRALQPGQRPNTDQERIDTWAEMTSQRAGVDLGPFYTAWGFPLSSATLEQMATLPPWTANPMLEQAP